MPITQDFLSTAVACGAGATVTNGTDFTSASIRVADYHKDPSYAVIIVTFTRTTGTSGEVDFEFQVSWDNGTTWSTEDYEKISLATNSDAVSNVVRHASMVWIPGISHVRLYRIVNNDGSTALTACNATLSIGLRR